MGALKLDNQGIIGSCKKCGQRNRVPFSKLGQSGVCGKCGANLLSSAEPVDIDTEDHFQTLIGQSALPVVVDFWAPWCPPCRAVAPEIAKFAQANAGKVLVAKVDTEALPGLGARFDIRSIPTMAVFKGGVEITRTSGARPAAAIEVFVRDSLAANAPR